MPTETLIRVCGHSQEFHWREEDRTPEDLARAKKQFQDRPCRACFINTRESNTREHEAALSRRQERMERNSQRQHERARLRQRDLFAAAALTGLLANSERNETISANARTADEYADAMMALRLAN